MAIPRLMPGALLALCAMLACTADSVTWEDRVRQENGWSAIAFDANGHLGDVRDEAPGSTMAASVPGAAGACTGSVRFADAGKRRFAVWWQPARSGAAKLMASIQAPQQAWGAAIVVDSTDASTLGCGRPAPAAAADTLTGNMYVAYWATTPLGAGVFAVHWMDGMFHASVPVEFGDRAANTAIAVSGHIVLVAYEDPNGTRPVISLAISHTDGHIFEARLQAAGEDLPATQPALALQGDRVAVAYTERSGEVGPQLRVRRMVRLGVVH